MHTHLGHPSNHAPARAIRVTGGSAAAGRAALQLRCGVCESQHHPGPPLRLRTDREFGDTAAIDLFVLVDYAGNQLSFTNILDLASTYGVVAMVPSKHPKVVWDHFLKHWITPCGVPRRLTYDHGEEFECEFGKELEDLGCELMPTAAITPQQNAVCDRHGGIWKTHARRLIDEFSGRRTARHGSPPPSPGLAILLLMTVGTLQRSGFSDEDYDCHTRCWTLSARACHT